MSSFTFDVARLESSFHWAPLLGFQDKKKLNTSCHSGRVFYSKASLKANNDFCLFEAMEKAANMLSDYFIQYY